MRLTDYRRKRDFTRSREPRGTARRPTKGALSFVVQKHAAQRLHYDFRLELEGVLRSWAVPKGPSLDPREKRLAVHVEDHPIEYAAFEGTIPEGEYGAGTVLLWDRGHWIPHRDPVESYRRGHLRFTLEGQKLRGDWTLIRMRGRASEDGKDNWLLIKVQDEAARSPKDGDILDEQPESVSGPRARRNRVWRSNRPARGRAASASAKAITLAAAGARATDRRAAARTAAEPTHLHGVVKSDLPDFISPQLATLVDRPPQGDDWVHEIKFDGYRTICRIEHGEARLLTRKGLDWTDRFGPIAAEAKNLPVERAMLDGEIVVLNAQGGSSFEALQEALSRGRLGDLIYVTFDLLYLNGYDLRGVPLVERKAALARMIPRNGGSVRYTDHFEGRGEEFFRRSCEFALEGAISKRRDAPYRSGRTGGWLKVKCERTRQEFVVGGYTDPQGRRSGFGSLLLGLYNDSGDLVYAGRVGTGFNEASLAKIHEMLHVLEQPKSPFVRSHPDIPLRRVHWVKPEVVADVAFRNWTRDNLVRQAAFQGLREDKPAREVVRERPVSSAGASPRSSSARPNPISKTKTSASGQTADAVAGVRLTHPDRVLYPDQELTKRALATFYEEIADWILPHVINRPLSLVRCPEGYAKQCFFQKHVNETTPDLIKSVEIKEDSGPKPYVYIEGLPGLITLVQMGVLEIHPWGTRVDRIEHPDRLIIDLDPSPDVDWELVVKTARHLHRRLTSLDLESFLKTTGGKGLHVVVPLQPTRTWDDVKAFAKAIAEETVDVDPKLYTTNPLKRTRKGKILIDYLRNARGATAVAAYSTRARAGAPVSTPLSWTELSPKVHSDAYTVENLQARLGQLKKDPWAGFFKVRQRITNTMQQDLGARTV